jgi:hypothetical protein
MSVYVYLEDSNERVENYWRRCHARSLNAWNERPIRIVHRCKRMISFSLAVAVLLFLTSCSMDPQTHPLNTAPIPENVRHLEQCSALGSMLCGVMSTFSGEAAVERRSACIAYVESSGRRVEQCGSLPASHP